jgi:hypothetical protein
MLDFLNATLSRCDYVTDSRASVLYLPKGKVNCSNCLLEWRVVLSALDVWIWCHLSTSRYGAVRCTKVAPCHLRTVNTNYFVLLWRTTFGVHEIVRVLRNHCYNCVHFLAVAMPEDLYKSPRTWYRHVLTLPIWCPMRRWRLKLTGCICRCMGDKCLISCSHHSSSSVTSSGSWIAERGSRRSLLLWRCKAWQCYLPWRVMKVAKLRNPKRHCACLGDQLPAARLVERKCLVLVTFSGGKRASYRKEYEALRNTWDTLRSVLCYNQEIDWSSQSDNWFLEIDALTQIGQEINRNLYVWVEHSTRLVYYQIAV